MSNLFEINATVRTDLGKGASRRLRRLNNQIPAIIYGGNKSPASVSILHKDIAHAIENEAFFSHIITLRVDDKPEQVIIKALQRHPARPIVLHADFQRVLADEAITVHVPIHFINEDKCVGVRLGGGNILHSMTDIEISCLPKDLPEYFVVDMLNIDVGESVHITDISFPAGVTPLALTHGDEDADNAVASVQAPRGAEVEAAAPAAASAVPAASAKKPDAS